MRFYALMLTVLLLVLSAAVVGTTRAASNETITPDGISLSLSKYREIVKYNQFQWTNRALDNRCRPKLTFDEYTKTPLAEVNPQWRNRHVFYAIRKHHRAQNKSSLCYSETLMDWYYSSGAKCVHEGEGAWTSNTGNGYYGGFQADISFQQTYNPGAYATYGTADNWPAIEQIEMAYNGWKARGFYPWPTTARNCGLI